jgi:hypothetical protein
VTYVPRQRADTDLWGANPVLLSAGIVAMIVATVGLFVRASPALSGAFLVVGAALIVIAVFERRGHAVHEVAPNTPDLSWTALQRSAASAEAEITQGRIRAVNDVVADR